MLAFLAPYTHAQVLERTGMHKDDLDTVYRKYGGRRPLDNPYAAIPCARCAALGAWRRTGAFVDVTHGWLGRDLR